MRNIPTIVLALAVLTVACSVGADETKSLPIVLKDDFESGADNWKPVGGSEWMIVDGDQGGKVYRMSGKSPYKPPVRSPRIISLVKDKLVGDFEITAKVQSTNYNAGNHRDMCLFWGYQDPSHFYYVHFGKKADPHACQIFIVDGKPRTKITKKESPGTPWDKKWHTVKIVRRVADGAIEVFFDDMKTPFMAAQDKTFVWGQVGIGTFDDNGNWDDFTLRGKVVEKPAE